MGSFPHSPSLSSLFVTSLIIQYLVSGVGTHDLCTHIILSEPAYGLETMKGFSMQIPYSLFSWCEVDKSVKGREAHKPLPENTFVASNILPIGTVYLKSKEGRGRKAPPWCPASSTTPDVQPPQPHHGFLSQGRKSATLCISPEPGVCRSQELRLQVYWNRPKDSCSFHF